MDRLYTIGKAIVFIENNLYNSIVVSDVSNAVSYSYYHFHRYFQAVMGETVGSYIRSRRLTQAALELITTDKNIMEIGISLRFESHEAFTRAFKTRYKMTPKQYRANGVNVLIGKKQAYIEENLRYLDNITLVPEIVSISQKCIIGMRFETTVMDNKSVVTWEQFNKKLANLDAVYSSFCRYEIFEVGDSCSTNTFNDESYCSVFIGIEIQDGFEIPSGMQMKILCSGKYARFTHTGAVTTLPQTYQYIWGTWFPKSDFEISGYDDFECYTERFLGSDNENSQIDIYFPII
ncbi:AraC family transcriptional regulator [Clostridium sp. SHJSY1]|uniref:AraC family transcriptional regulator n=1 Tax=Clostridium sp. SHJSY1 TaxID=2942483 RepID=UPI002876C3AA|nr:AraC family transcriptional regulator [Clostridium sp. SHJSY1]MDS0526501.1 AraC family transcriptional regulator [Clostridium sp. SHJSY1]